MVLDGDQERRKRVRRTALVLGFIALAFYLGFIVMSVVKSSRNGRGAAAQSSATQR